MLPPATMSVEALLLPFIYLFVTVLGLHCCEGFFLVVEGRDYSPGVATPRLSSTGSVVVAAWA